MDQSALLDWFSKRPEIKYVSPFIVDINGVFRGKRLSSSKIEKIVDKGIRMPLSAANADIWGKDIEDSPLVFKTGDADGKCVWTGRKPLVTASHKSLSAMLPMSFLTDEGVAFDGDPRNVLISLVSKFTSLKLRPVVAFELEFYLADPKAHDGSLVNPLTGAVTVRDGVLSIDDINNFSEFFHDVYESCKLNGVDADATISESGLCQFEVNLSHTHNVLKATDDAIFFKKIVKCIAQKHGFTATFMAKPFADRPGSGFHMHFSILNENSCNIFDDGAQAGSDIMKNCISGILDHMRQSTILFAPHLNSYRRMTPGHHAPTSALWGYENRTAAVRVPGGDSVDRRIEHRVAGADCNPYLVTTAVLGAALSGIKSQTFPPAPTEGNCYDVISPDAYNLPRTWEEAIDLFRVGDGIDGCIPEQLHDMIVRAKKQEISVFGQKITPFEYQSYLEQV